MRTWQRRGAANLLFRGRRERANGDANGEAPPGPAPDAAALMADVERISATGAQDPETLREIVRLRHRAGVQLVRGGAAGAPYPAPAGELPPPADGELPGFAPGELTPELLRAAILRDGCAVVRGQIDRDRAAALGRELEQLFERRDRGESGNTEESLAFEEFVPDPPYTLIERPWVNGNGGVWLADSPKLMTEVFDLYEQVGLRELVTGYLGGRPVASVNKSTLRRARADVSAIDWHQDGAFMGDVRTLNVWLSLSHCGQDAPGLYVVPRRIEEIVATGTAGANYDWSVSPAVAEEAAGPVGTLRPTFEPGDVVLFDNFFLHATWVDAGMTGTRYAVESWFFSPSGFPQEYVPLAF